MAAPRKQTTFFSLFIALTAVTVPCRAQIKFTPGVPEASGTTADAGAASRGSAADASMLSLKAMPVSSLAIPYAPAAAALPAAADAAATPALFPQAIGLEAALPDSAIAPNPPPASPGSQTRDDSADTKHAVGNGFVRLTRAESGAAQPHSDTGRLFDGQKNDGTILVTGFEPFLGAKHNVSADAARGLHGARLEVFARPGDEHPAASYYIASQVLPVSYERAGSAIADSIQRLRPDAVLMLALSGRTPSLEIEKIARNGMNQIGAPDADGRVHEGTPIDPAGPDAHRTSIPVDEMLRSFAKSDFPARASEDAGGYVCNTAYYCALQAAVKAGLALAPIFMHLPPAVEHLSDQEKSSLPHWPLAALHEAVGDAARWLAAHAVKAAASKSAEPVDLPASPEDDHSAIFAEADPPKLRAALARLAEGKEFSLNQRIVWINSFLSYYHDRKEPWTKDFCIAFFRDYAEKSLELRAAAEKTTTAAAKRTLLLKADVFEHAVNFQRTELRNRAENNLSVVFAMPDLQKRNAVLAQGLMEAEVLGDAELVAAFKPLIEDPTETGWGREMAGAANKALIRLTEGTSLALNQRIRWINAFISYYASRKESWPPELEAALLRDYAEKSRELRDASEQSPEEATKNALAHQAREFEIWIDKTRVSVRDRAETSLSSVFSPMDHAILLAALAQGYKDAKLLGDTESVAAFKTLMTDPTEAGWNREMPGAAKKAVVRLRENRELTLKQRIIWINALAAYFNSHGEAWTKDFCVTFFSGYAEASRELNGAAATSKEEAVQKDLLGRAKTYEDAAAQKRSELAARSRTFLEAARKTMNPGRYGLFIKEGSMLAEVLDDKDLIASFSALPSQRR